MSTQYTHIKIPHDYGISIRLTVQEFAALKDAALRNNTDVFTLARDAVIKYLKESTDSVSLTPHIGMDTKVLMKDLVDKLGITEEEIIDRALSTLSLVTSVDEVTIVNTDPKE